MSLKRIVLRDFVIVSELELDLDSGFTVLTGETGAGKSILIDALQLVTGARADTGVIREGASRTDVSAEFDTPAGVRDTLQESGFDDSDTLLLRRTVDTAGKSRAWINGSPATAQQLRTVGEQLLDIHGQHAWQSLTRPDAVRGLLDAYAKVSTATLGTLWLNWRQAQATLAQAVAAQDSLQRERERLAWQIGEVEKLNPLADEWDELQTSHSRLANGQALLEAAQGALQLLEDDDHNVLHLLNNALQQVQNQLHLEPDFQDPVDVLSSSLAQAEDSVRTLRGYLRRTELDPQRLAELDERLSQWVSLARRYKRAPDELPALLASWRAELVQLDAASDLEGLQSAEKQAQAAYMQEAKALGKARAKAAPLLAESITQAMQGLGMQGGQFQVQLEASAQPMQSGLEDVCFLVAGHAGSTPRPVGKVASGGELSRIALAISVCTSEVGSAPTLIFDEVDSGIGGAVAHTVGQLMRRLGHDRQVLAVTHLPQVAACAHQHLRVSKGQDAQGSSSRVEPLHGAQRVAEVARMLGGQQLTATTLAHAQELLCNSS
ncbi:MAG: DNA repair protein RecN [Burkholderiaceae bacterium]|nr:DNA repair protein RecN [Burkholderiaceae bacterium]